MTTKARYGATTFILGAGASFHAGYPLVASMGEQLFEWMREPREASSVLFDFAECANALEGRFSNNIESVLNEMGAEIERRGQNRAFLADCYRPALVEAMRQWFAEIHRQHPARAYERFATEIVQPGDTIITFNCDVSLDSQMFRSGNWCVGDGYGFLAKGLPAGSKVKIFKLHGSINWFALLFGGLTGMFASSGRIFGSRPCFCDGDLSALGYVGIADGSFPLQGSAAISPLILPTGRKRFYFQTNWGREWNGFWDRLWRKARQAIRESSRVVVLGYGMRSIDRRGCNLLLRGGFEADVEVCCGEDSSGIVQQLRKIGRDAHLAEKLLFEDWVSAQARRRANV